MLLTGGVMLAVTHTSSALIMIGMSLLFALANGFSGLANQAALYLQAPAGEIAVASGRCRTFVSFGAFFSASPLGALVVSQSLLSRSAARR
jgi:hypothetical protein